MLYFNPHICMYDVANKTIYYYYRPTFHLQLFTVVYAQRMASDKDNAGIQANAKVHKTEKSLGYLLTVAFDIGTSSSCFAYAYRSSPHKIDLSDFEAGGVSIMFCVLPSVLTQLINCSKDYICKVLFFNNLTYNHVILMNSYHYEANSHLLIETIP